jgi:hypothetical protein
VAAAVFSSTVIPHTGSVAISVSFSGCDVHGLGDISHVKPRRDPATFFTTIRTFPGCITGGSITAA